MLISSNKKTELFMKSSQKEDFRQGTLNFRSLLAQVDLDIFHLKSIDIAFGFYSIHQFYYFQYVVIFLTVPVL